ncbi:extracellular solute-binding protein [Pseudogracilibacillus sp. SE30717A]|uniref:ABC transporter substrate-binding protein n=1 Tax=Pseudogracilibacillus sp. SE30717A TaxID=3098293 RepID=UPI00300E3DFD
MKKSLFLKMMAFALACLLLVACSSKDSSKTTDDSESAGDGTSGEITVASWAAAADALEEAAENYMEENPDAKITIQRVGHGYENIIPPLTAGMGAPDIVHVEQRDFQTFLRQFDGQFMDLTDQIGERKDEFAAIAWEAVEKDDKVLGVPWDLGPAAVWYRADYYEEAGINPDDIETWDDFIEAGKQLQEKVDGVKMVTFDTSGSDANPSTWMILMNQLSGQYNDEEGNINFANEPNIKAMEMVKKFKDEGIVYDSGDWSALVRTITNGDAASVILPVWLAGTISGQASDQAGQWNVMKLPAFEEGGPHQANLGGGVLAVTENSESKDLAVSFIEYALLTNEGQDVQMKYGLFPSWQPYYESEGFSKEDEFFGFKLSDFFASVSTDIPKLDFGPYYMDFHSELLDAYGNVMNDVMDAEEALKNAEERSSSSTGLDIAD